MMMDLAYVDEKTVTVTNKSPGLLSARRSDYSIYCYSLLNKKEIEP